MSFLLSLLGCSRSNEKEARLFVRDLTAAAGNLKVSQELRMDAINKGEWSRLFVFAPYTPLSEIETALGMRAPTHIRNARLEERDDINLLVFLDREKIQIVAAVPRGVDFSVPKEAQPLDRRAAVFKILGAGRALTWTGAI